MHKKITALSLLLLLVNIHASAPRTKATSVWGTMYVVGNMQYCGEDPDHALLHRRLLNIVDDNLKPITFKATDVLVKVWADSDESKNWCDHGHPVLGDNFPSSLPLSMLDDKKEDDPLKFTLFNPKNKTVCNVLVFCKGRNSEKLELQIDRLKLWFANEVNFNHGDGDEERLFAQKAVVKNPLYKEVEILQYQLSNLGLDPADPQSFQRYMNGHGNFREGLFAQESKTTTARRAQLKKTITQKKQEWIDAGNKLTNFDTIPKYMHGPNGFKYVQSKVLQNTALQPSLAQMEALTAQLRAQANRIKELEQAAGNQSTPILQLEDASSSAHENSLACITSAASALTLSGRSTTQLNEVD